jgi:5'-nucleotidase
MAESLTDDELVTIVDSYKRKRLNRTSSQTADDRVYVNRSVSMERIKYIGFDMDYTLVEYKSPEYEMLCFDMVIKRLISIGYPPEIADLKYDPTFPLRGLFFDKQYGNLLKADQFGNILSCFHGFKSLTSAEIRRQYPNKYVQPTDESRIHILYTLFQLPEIYLLAALVDFFENKSPGYTRIEQSPDTHGGVQCGDVLITYQMIWWDVRTSVDWLHVYGDVKEKTVKNLERYVVKDPILPLCIHKLRSSGMKTFIATNSDYRYTQTIMTHLFDYPEGPDGGPHRSWREYFDYVIVDAKKPRFFEEGSMLREVDEDTTSLKLGVFTGALKPGRVYSGGSSGAFCKYSGAKGKEILYVGDHIFGDVIKAKKEQAWRTFLVLPELKKEVKVWESTQSLFLRLQNLSYILAEVYGSGSGPTDGGVKLPDMNSLRRALKITSQEMEDSYPSRLGSLLRCGEDSH